MAYKQCTDMESLDGLKEASRYVCETCEKNGGDWVHLRTCQTCGVTLCCDSSPAKHMSAHFRETGHPVITSAEPGERWMWCYTHELFSPF